MSNDQYASFANKYKQLLEEQMTQLINDLQAPSIIKESMNYSMQAGGKRIRPMLLLATIQAFRKDPLVGMYPAIALEMIHTYSLIHDDLPSMDNDDLRRGKPTNHKVFGDAIAILAGDALLTYSFQIIASMPNHLATDEMKVAVISLLSKAAGAEGMVGGQTADIEGEGKNLTIDQLEYIHVHKTGKLIEFSVLAGAILAGATEKQIEQLKKFAYHIGIAFQIRDDILDVEGNEQDLGKPLGSDQEKDKNTYPTLLTMAGAKKALIAHMNKAQTALKETGLQTNMLEEITKMIACREN